MRPLAALLILVSARGWAEPLHTGDVSAAAPEARERNYVNLRGGATSSSRHPEICLDVSPIELISLEACGTGSGFLHRDADPEIAHFRANVRLYSWRTPVGQVEPRASLGIGEIQIGEDDPGFQFSGVGPRAVETAGPEAGLSVRTLFPVGAGFELVGSLNLNLLWSPHAPQLAMPGSVLTPSVSLTLGVGF